MPSPSKPDYYIVNALWLLQEGRCDQNLCSFGALGFGPCVNRRNKNLPQIYWKFGQIEANIQIVLAITIYQWDIF